MSKVSELINEHSFDINTECRDEHNNTLLHLAVKSKLHSTALYLVRRGADRNKKNSFGESPWDIAVTNQDNQMIRILLNFQDTINGLKEDKTRLSKEVLELQEERDNLVKSGKKRKRCEDCEVKDREIKRVKREKEDVEERVVRITTQVSELEKDNQTLKTTVDSLRSSFKK